MFDYLCCSFEAAHRQALANEDRSHPTFKCNDQACTVKGGGVHDPLTQQTHKLGVITHRVSGFDSPSLIVRRLPQQQRSDSAQIRK